MDSEQQPSGERPPNGSDRQKGKQPATLVSRIASSASRLVQDAVGPSSANNLSNTLSSATGLGSKVQAGSSSNTQNQWFESLPSRPRAPGLATGRLNASSESFRSSPTQAYQDHEIDQFLMTESSSFVPELTRGSSQSPESWTNEFRHRPSDHSGATYGMDYDDGAEVRMLLSDSNIDLAPDYMDFEMADSVEADMDDLFKIKLSPDEQRAADRIRSSLPSPPLHHSILRDNPLNLLPGVMDLPQIAPGQPIPKEQIAELIGALDGSGWDEVLDRYTDDVWGESLQRFVEESIQQGQIQHDPGHADRIQLDGQALSRLKMILGHVAEMTSSKAASQQSHGLEQQNSEGVRQARLDGSSALAHMSTGIGINGLRHQGMMGNATMAQHEHAYTQSSHYETQSTVSGKAAERVAHDHQRRREGPIENEQDQDQPLEPTFHCPWIRCHQRFNDARELRFHTSVHTQYACPHEDCTAQFQSHEEWADHITGPHHDLLEHRSMTPLSSEKS